MDKFVSSGEIHEAWVEFINDSVQLIDFRSKMARVPIEPYTCNNDKLASIAKFQVTNGLCKF